MFKLSSQQKAILKEAEAIYALMASNASDEVFNSPELSAELFKTRLVGEEREHFEVLFLNQQHIMIDVQRLFSGTINQASVHPREIAKKALELNAAAIVIAHNHPSGKANPSKSDINMTRIVKDAMELIEVKLLDHIIVGHHGLWHSMAQAGEI
ncbi:DNA repair protein RadC [Thiomicrospira aerophila AL3]|uniref:DNA repair protein RadC n=1 Tax=Thiomicrospira aerophila AL3 TaxID=717772 RepID=W0DSG3_9GAMM|nr:DNA repair protein RadC [Thiomicrospira aerophila]AHF01392.1 DNA repair protein RadC [Thiomicrospira aerophila AL3]